MNTFREADHPRGGKPGNPGQFSVKTHKEAECSLDDADPNQPLYDEEGRLNEEFAMAKIRSKISESDPWQNELVYVEQGDQLDEEQVDLLLAGEIGTLDESIDSWLSDHIEENARERLNELCHEVGFKSEELGADAHDEMIELIKNSDTTSDPVRDLTRGSGLQLMRASLTEEDSIYDEMIVAWTRGDLNDDQRENLCQGNTSDSQARADFIENTLLKHGVITKEDITEETRETLLEMVDNGPYDWHEGVVLDVIWNGDIDTAALKPNYRRDNLEHTTNPGKTLKSQDGVSIVLLDTMNGSGCDAQLNIPATVKVTPQKPAHLDSGGRNGGYGWDDTAGVVHSFYNTDFEIV